MEDSYKRRLRERQRYEMDKRRPGSLASQGWAVSVFKDGAFHLFARKGKTARMIRFSFGTVHYDEVMVIKREPVPDRCAREIWKYSGNGIARTIAKIE